MDVYINMHEITWLWGNRDWDFKVSRKVQYVLRVSRKLWESVEKPIRKLLARYACDMPEICLRYTLSYFWYMSEIYLKYAWDMPQISPRYASDMPEICPRYASGMPEIYLRYARDMPETRPQHAWDIPERCLRHDQICLSFTWDMPKMCLR